MTLEQLINILTNNGLGIACVIYTLWGNSMIMKDIGKTLININDRLSRIENNIEDIERYMKG